MSLYKELQQILNLSHPVAGQVIAKKGQTVTVATPSGLIEVIATNTLHPGDKVSVHNGQATKKQGGGNAVVYHV